MTVRVPTAGYRAQGAPDAGLPCKGEYRAEPRLPVRAAPHRRDGRRAVAGLEALALIAGGLYVLVSTLTGRPDGWCRPCRAGSP